MIKKIISLLTVFLLFSFPLFFIPFQYLTFPDQDKQYLLGFVTFLLLILCIIQFFVRKKLKFVTTSYGVLLTLLAVVYLTSTILFSANKIETLNQSLSTGMIITLTVLYLLITQSAFSVFPLLISSGISGVIFLINNMGLIPQLKLPADNLATFTFFLPVTVLAVSETIRYIKSVKKKNILIHLSSRLIIALSVFSAVIVSLFNIIKSPAFPALPFRFGWETVLEIYKNIFNFAFGAGPLNFPFAFSLFRPISINNSIYWNLIPNQSTSFLLTLASEAGFTALLIFVFIVVAVIKQTKTDCNYYFPSLMAVTLFLIIFPANISLLFLFFIILALYSTKTEIKEISLYRFKPIIYLLGAILLFAGFALFWQTRFFLSDLLFKTALVEANNNNPDKSLKTIGLALKMNPYSEKNYILSANLQQFIFSNIAKDNQSADSEKQKIYSDAFIASVTMTKNAISLNPNNGKYWESLLNIYSNLPDDDKDKPQLLVDTVSRLNQLDPVSPLPKLTAAAILISLNKSQQAESVLTQAINLKPDLNSSHFALANLYAQTGNFPYALPQMRKALDLTSPKDQDYQKLKDQLNQLEKLASEATKSAEKVKTKK